MNAIGSTTDGQVERCQHCAGWHVTKNCPFVSAIEYYENGSVKRIEFYKLETVEILPSVVKDGKAGTA